MIMQIEEVRTSSFFCSCQKKVACLANFFDVGTKISICIDTNIYKFKIYVYKFLKF